MIKHLLLIDDKGTNRLVYAAKPTPVEKNLMIILHDNHSMFNPFVVHLFNLQTGECRNGHYFDTIEKALIAFNEVN